jgi:hypothetical protein
MPTIIIGFWREWGDGLPFWRALEYLPDADYSFWLLDADEVRYF